MILFYTCMFTRYLWNCKIAHSEIVSRLKRSKEEKNFKSHIGMIQFALKKSTKVSIFFQLGYTFLLAAASAFMEADHRRFFIMPKPWSWIPNVFFLLLIHPFALKKIEPPHIRSHIVPYKYLQDVISTYLHSKRSRR